MSTKWILRIACMLQVVSISILYMFDAVRMKDLGIGETAIGIILGIGSGVFIVSSIFWGRLADRKHWHKVIAVWGSFGFSALLLYFSICGTVWEFLVYSILKSVIGPMVMGMMPALAVASLGPTRQGRNYGVYRAFGSLGFVLGSLTLPIIFDDIAMIARVGAVIILFSFLLLRRLSEPETNPIQGVPMGMRGLNPVLKLFFVSFFFISLAEPSVQSFFNAYARHLGGSTRLVGLLSAFMGITALIFLPLMGKAIDRINPTFILTISFIAQPVRVLVTSQIGQAEMLWVPLLFHGICWGGVEVAAIVYLSSLAKAGQKATVLSFYMAVRMLGFLIGSAMSGYLAENIGYVLMFQTIAAVSLVGVIIYILGTYVFKVGEDHFKLAPE